MRTFEGAPSPVFLYKLHHSQGTPKSRWWLGGNLATPIPVDVTDFNDSVASVLEARLTGDLRHVVFNYTPATGSAIVKYGPTPGNSGSTVNLATGADASNPVGFACFNGDESKVVYAASNGAYGEIRIVNVDTTGDTLLYNRGGSGSGELLYANIESLLVNHGGTKICWVDQSQSVGGFTNAGIYVMDIDGSNVSRIVDWSGLDFTTSDHLIGFSHDDAYLAFTQTYDDGSGTKVHFKKVTTGGSVTDLFASASYFRQQYDYQWLPDDSGVLAVHANVYGSQPRSVIEVIPAAGGSPTALSPERRIDTSGTITTPRNYPVVCDADSRIYWYDLATTSVVSVAAGGSDFRTDHTLDGTGTSTTNDQDFRTLFTGG